MAPEAKETYQNLSTLFSLINLNALCGVIPYTIASDLKLLMILLGLQTCSSTHPCPWCDSKNLAEAGMSRTFESIQKNYLRWKSEGKEKLANAKRYGTKYTFSHDFVMLFI